MTLIPGAKERTEDEYREFYDSVGFNFGEDRADQYRSECYREDSSLESSRGKPFDGGSD